MAYQIGNTEVEGYGYITFFTLNSKDFKKGFFFYTHFCDDSTYRS